MRAMSASRAASGGIAASTSATSAAVSACTHSVRFSMSGPYQTDGPVIGGGRASMARRAVLRHGQSPYQSARHTAPASGGRRGQPWVLLTSTGQRTASHCGAVALTARARGNEADGNTGCKCFSTPRGEPVHTQGDGEATERSERGARRRPGHAASALHRHHRSLARSQQAQRPAAALFAPRRLRGRYLAGQSALRRDRRTEMLSRRGLAAGRARHGNRRRCRRAG